MSLDRALREFTTDYGVWIIVMMMGAGVATFGLPAIPAAMLSGAAGTAVRVAGRLTGHARSTEDLKEERLAVIEDGQTELAARMAAIEAGAVEATLQLQEVRHMQTAGEVVAALDEQLPVLVDYAEQAHGAPFTRAEREKVKFMLEAWTLLGWSGNVDMQDKTRNAAVADAAALARDLWEAYDRAIGEDKRRLLRNIFLNTFNEELYKAGMAKRMAELVNALEAPEVRTLKELRDKQEWTRRNDWQSEGGDPLLVFHLTQLAERRLIRFGSGWNSSRDAYFNVFTNAPMRVTQLGSQFLLYVAEPNPKISPKETEPTPG